MKTAIVGAGVIGTIHARILSEQGRSVCAICDTEIAKARSLAAACAPDARIYAEYEEMIAVEKIDVIHICTPHYLHVEQAIYALEHGVNVLCEKPLASHPDELEAVLLAEKRSRAKLGVVQQNRYNAATRFALDFLRYHKVTSGHASVVWSRGVEYFAASPWRGKLYEAGGGALINQALHTLDLLMLFCGMPSYVTARADIMKAREGVEVEDTVSAHFGGAVEFSFFATINAAENLPTEIVLMVEGGQKLTVFQKSVLLDDRLIFTDDGTMPGFCKSYYGNAHGALFDDFYDCVASGRKFPITAAEAARLMRLIFAVYESGGERVNIR